MIDVVIEEKTSDCCIVRIEWKREGGERKADAIINDVLVARAVVNVDRDAAQGGDFGGEGGEAGVVLSVWSEGWKEVCGRGEGEEGRTARGRRRRTWWAGGWM